MLAAGEASPHAMTSSMSDEAPPAVSKLSPNPNGLNVPLQAPMAAQRG